MLKFWVLQAADYLDRVAHKSDTFAWPEELPTDAELEVMPFASRVK